MYDNNSTVVRSCQPPREPWRRFPGCRSRRRVASPRRPRRVLRAAQALGAGFWSGAEHVKGRNSGQAMRNAGPVDGSGPMGGPGLSRAAQEAAGAFCGLPDRGLGQLTRASGPVRPFRPRKSQAIFSTQFRFPRFSKFIDTGGAEGGARLGQAAPTTYAEGGGLPFAFQGPGLVRRTTPRRESKSFAAASPVKPRGGLCRNARPVEHTGTVAYRTISVPSASERWRGTPHATAARTSPGGGWGLPGEVPAGHASPGRASA